MKTTTTLTAIILLAASTLGFADSKRTSEYLLVDPKSHVDKEVTLDVSFVKPVHWKSPLAEIAFYHAVTMDRTDHKRGGSILVAVPAEESAKFARKYGMDFEGRNATTALRGTFVLIHRRGPSGIWAVDTSGKLLKLLADKKAVLPAGADKPADPGAGPAKGRRPFRAR